MTTQFGTFDDWPAFAAGQARHDKLTAPALAPAAVRRLIGMPEAIGAPGDARVERVWERDGILGEEISWSVGYGPRTTAWLLRPSAARGPLPGVLALHSHDDVKAFGKEKIADGPDELSATHLAAVRRTYGDRAFANALALQGFTVLVPDVFLWGSRRFEREAIESALASASQFAWLKPFLGEDQRRARQQGLSDEERYERMAVLHEDVIERECRVLGTSLAGVVAYEDSLALHYLRSRADVCQGDIGVIGCSGGGARAALLGATSPDIALVAVICMMSSYREMVEQHVASHTWLLFPPGLAPAYDWPDLVLTRAPGPLLVQYARSDELFPLSGMMAAHEAIAARYGSLGRPEAYVGQFFEGGHRFDRPMQEAAFAQLASFLR